MIKKLAYIILFIATPYLGKSQVWSSLGSGLTSVPDCLSPLEKLYVGAGYPPSSFSGIPFNGIFSLNGSSVDTLASGLFGYASAARWFNNKLIVGGSFNYAGQGPFGIPQTVRIAAWDSLAGWSSITPNGPLIGGGWAVTSMSIYNGYLYVGGDFTSIDNQPSNCISKWNGTTWSNVGAGLNGYILCMNIYHGQLYVGGNFSVAGSTSALNIARWNGIQWDSVAGGFNNYVWAMTVDSLNDLLYVAGGFTSTGNTTSFGVAKWNDTTWAPVGSGTDTLWGTHCLAMYNGELYAGGGNVTVTAQGDTLRNVYKYNGTKWVSVDGGADNTVEEMCVFQGNLYVGGHFWQVGSGVSSSRLACYGTTCPIGVGISEQAPPVPFKMFPNPNDDVLHIESEEPQQMIFRLSSSDGKLVSEKKFFSKMDYSTKKLASGNYFIQVSLVDGSRMHTEKLLIK